MTTADNFVFSDEELAPYIGALPGQVHNRSRVNQDAEDMQKLYRDSGYVYARVVPQVTLNREAHTTAITHQVDEDELKYIREVRVEGNSITKDEVIRRNILLKPGERFDQSLKDISDRRLQQTGYFESHRLRLEGEDENDRFTNVIADVVEGKTGDFNFGGAFTSEEGVSADSASCGCATLTSRIGRAFPAAGRS
jgi:outer membrane protein insertion porin family